MPTYLYAVTGPSGRMYFGVSKNVHARWLTHRRKARVEDGRHPFYDSIRKHGHEAFVVSTVYEFESAEAARAAEQVFIHFHRNNGGPLPYNVSRGGEYDATDGHAAALAAFRADPAKFDAYRAKLSASLKKAAAEGRIDPSALLAYTASRPKREVWKQMHRAQRIKAKLGRKRESHLRGRKNGNGEAVKAAWEAQPPSVKKRHGIQSRKQVTEVWAGRSPDEKNSIFTKIGDSLRRRYEENAEYRKEVDAKLARGRGNMDRAKQGAAASAGLKKFWNDLRADPERYAAYMARRTASLMETICKK